MRQLIHLFMTYSVCHSGLDPESSDFGRYNGGNVTGYRLSPV